MKYRKLCDEKVSILGFGAMRLPTKGDKTSEINIKQTEIMFDHALANGINYIDTAYPYHGGESENVVGNYLTRRHIRDDIFLASKLPSWLIKEKKDFDKYFNEQLDKLKTDHIDFYLLHSLNENTWQKIKGLGVLDWCEKKQAEGKIKHLGFSFHDQYPIFKKIIDSYDKWGFCQIQFNYMDIDFQAGQKGLEYAHKKGLDIIVMEPIRGGQLAKEPPLEIKKIWNQFPIKRSYADGALQWIWNRKDVSIVLSGMSELRHVKENIESANRSKVGSLKAEESDLYLQIRKIFLKRAPINCTSCKYCEPCPQGVAISSCLNFYMMSEIYDDKKRASMFYHFLKEEYRADKCIQCGECEPKCPQKIPIMRSLENTHKLLAKKL
ncbi:MAG: aldo/keto reductase [Candidatus Cloacimonetes bacterium]|nr:aldo/keto reductase [Candidatus Cloacimonadota bacterium]